jgi:hypothetical protein
VICIRESIAVSKSHLGKLWLLENAITARRTLVVYNLLFFFVGRRYLGLFHMECLNLDPSFEVLGKISELPFELNELPRQKAQKPTN